jgi:holo-[acyl-carrier protein] synthase
MHEEEVSRRVIPAVGFDVQSIKEVEASIEKFGIRYTRRIFTSHEIDCCRGEPASSYASRFAAKEAVFKILNPLDAIPLWKEIEVNDLTGGRAEIGMRGVAAELARRRGIVNVSVSVSCGGGFAMAAAVANVEIRSK